MIAKGASANEVKKRPFRPEFLETGAINLDTTQIQCDFDLVQECALLQIRLQQKNRKPRKYDLERHSRKASTRPNVGEPTRAKLQERACEDALTKMSRHYFERIVDRRQAN